MNKISLVGCLCDPVKQYTTNGGIDFVVASVASKRPHQNGEQYFRLKLWRSDARTFASSVNVGDKIGIDGYMLSYKDKNDIWRWEVNVEKWEVVEKAAPQSVQSAEVEGDFYNSQCPF